MKKLIKALFVIFAVCVTSCVVTACGGGSDPKPTVTPTPSTAPSVSIAPSVMTSTAPSVSISPTVSVTPSVLPTTVPTVVPTIIPTLTPTVVPTIIPTLTPSVVPTAQPTVIPSVVPSVVPSVAPTATPSVAPSVLPSVSVIPSVQPSAIPSVTPTSTPSVVPSVAVSVAPSVTPGISPTPTITPTATPSVAPSSLPTVVPSVTPSVPEELTPEQELENYLESAEMSASSPYSGLLKGQNIITIMVESGEWYGIDPSFTPTLCALMNQGYQNQSFYAEDKTDKSEAIAILGSYPEGVSFTNADYTANKTLLNNTLSFSLPSLLSADGYTTTYLHSNWGSFYGREETHGVYGFDNVYMLEDMDLPSSQNRNKDFYEFELDSDLFGKNLNKIAPTDGTPFYSFVTTVITHGHYEELIAYGDYASYLTDAQREERAKKYLVKGLIPYYQSITQTYFKQKFKAELMVNGLLNEEGKVPSGKDADIYTRYLRYKRYQAGMADLDRGVALLLQHLKDNNLLENTTILFFGDHCAYYNDQNYYMKGISKGQAENPESYRILFGMYSGKSPLHIPETGFTHAGDDSFPLTRKTERARFTTTYDIVPTILDLLGYTYNRGLYMGNSMFSHAQDITFLSRKGEGGMFNDKYYSLDGQEILYGDTSNEMAVTAFRQGIQKYRTKQQQFNVMYLRDFFKNYDVSQLVYLR